jgi:hypothetical protein
MVIASWMFSQLLSFLWSDQYHIAFSDCCVSLLVPYALLCSFWVDSEWTIKGFFHLVFHTLLMWIQTEAICDGGFTSWLEISKRKTFTKTVITLTRAVAEETLKVSRFCELPSGKISVYQLMSSTRIIWPFSVVHIRKNWKCWFWNYILQVVVVNYFHVTNFS